MEEPSSKVQFESSLTLSDQQNGESIPAGKREDMVFFRTGDLNGLRNVDGPVVVFHTPNNQENASTSSIRHRKSCLCFSKDSEQTGGCGWRVVCHVIGFAMFVTCMAAILFCSAAVYVRLYGEYQVCEDDEHKGELYRKVSVYFIVCTLISLLALFLCVASLLVNSLPYIIQECPESCSCTRLETIHNPQHYSPVTGGRNYATRKFLIVWYSVLLLFTLVVLIVSSTLTAKFYSNTCVWTDVIRKRLVTVLMCSAVPVIGSCAYIFIMFILCLKFSEWPFKQDRYLVRYETESLVSATMETEN